MSEEDALNGTALERLRKLGGTKLVRQMIELYLANGPERIRSLREGAEADDVDKVERAAHTLKSSAGNLGAVHLQRTADAVEAVAADGSIDRDLVDRMVEQYEASERALGRILAELEE